MVHEKTDAFFGGRIVVDTYAMVSFVFGQKDAGKVEKILHAAVDKKVELLMSAVNFGELYYVVYRKAGKDKAESLHSMLSDIPVNIMDVDYKTAVAAAGYKTFRKMSYADCFCAALAKQSKASVLTGDKEFKEVEDEVKVVWL